MKMNVLKVIFFYLMLFYACSAVASSNNNFILSGSDWFIHEDNGIVDETSDMLDGSWIRASVPGNIQADLEAAHVLRPLWYGLGDPKLPDVARKNWWYRKDFVVPKDFEGKRITIIFQGVDHECMVYLNGIFLGKHEGMFERFSFDITDKVKIGDNNKLAVRISRAPEQIVEQLIKFDAPDSAPGSFGEALTTTRKMLKHLKSPTNGGWDWGVNIYTLGIWKGVHLEATGPARIEWIQTITNLSDDFTNAEVKIALDINSTTNIDAIVKYQIIGPDFRTVHTSNFSIKEGKNKTDIQIPITRPKLWWPNGQGAQPLYDLRIELVDTKSGELIDTRTERFGIRRIEWKQVEGAPEDFINPFRLVVNGRTVRNIGSNLIPPDLLFGRIECKIETLIKHAKNLGINTLRIWGGGVVLPERFYDLADENGIMLFQEFILANSWPETDNVFLANLERTAANIIKQIRNHPSIIEWSGGNEMPWKQGTDHAALHVLEKVTAEFDDRIFRATCPIQGSTHGRWWYYLNSHYDYYNNLNTMRHGEFGTQTPAHLETWHRQIPVEHQWPIEGVTDPVLIRKNVVEAVFRQDFWLIKKEIDGMFGPSDNLEELIMAGQFIGAEGLRYALDSHRIKGKRIGGFCTWDFNEPWPNGAGSYLIDYNGRPLMNYYFAKQSFAPVTLCLKYDSIMYDPSDGIKADLWIVSDKPNQTTKLTWKWIARDRNGQVLAEKKGITGAGYLEPKKVDEIHLKLPLKLALGPVFLEFCLQDNNGIILNERIHIFSAKGFTGQLRGLIKNSHIENNSFEDDKTVIEKAKNANGPNNSANFAYVGNSASPAVASSEHSFSIHKAGGINDGLYGNEHSWIANVEDNEPYFIIDLNKIVTVGKFKFGRDRMGRYDDRAVDNMVIQTSLDGKDWEKVFDQKGISGMKGFKAYCTTEISIPAVNARFIKVGVEPESVCIDEFEVYPPDSRNLDNKQQIVFMGISTTPFAYRPVKRTELKVVAKPVHSRGREEVIELDIKNTGDMTAIFCDVHPLIEYRTDLYIDNNYCFIPPGESRIITIKASKEAKGGLTLAQTGWRTFCWNADDVIISPDESVLLSVGRRDMMCREYFGYGDKPKSVGAFLRQLEGNRPPTSSIPLLQIRSEKPLKFIFEVSAKQALNTARLRIHTSDQSNKVNTELKIHVNNQLHTKTLPLGLGIQKDTPSHLGNSNSVDFNLPEGIIKEGTNTITIAVTNDGWFTLDSLDLVSM